MKKIILILLCFFLLGFDRRIQTIDDIVYYYKTPKEIASWIRKNIWYRKDIDKWGVRDYWQTSEETLTIDKDKGERTGDCEDFAILARDCLYLIDINAELFIFRKTKTLSHAVCIFEYNNKWCYIDLGDYCETRAKSKDELKQIIRRK